MRNNHITMPRNQQLFSTKQSASIPTDHPRQRSVRGEGSMVEAINSRLCDIEELIKDLEIKKHLIGIDLPDLFDQLVTIADKSDSIIQPLVALEKDIEKQKRISPNYQKYHRVFIDIQQLRDLGDNKAADELEASQDSNFHKFQQEYSALIPLIDKARELRFDLLTEKRKLLRIHYNLMRASLNWQTNEVLGMIENHFGEESQYKEYRKLLKPWENIAEFNFTTWKEDTSITRQITMLEDDINTLYEEVDYSLPTASEFINKIAHLIQKEIVHLTAAV